MRLVAAVILVLGLLAAPQRVAPQTAKTVRVAALETDLGVRLLERSTRRLNVTHVGEDIYEHAQAAQDQRNPYRRHCPGRRQ